MPSASETAATGQSQDAAPVLPGHSATSRAAFAGVSAITTKIALRAGSELRFADWQSAFTRVASVAAGFVSLELIPTYAGSAEWQIVQRFRSPQSLEAWRAADERADLLAGLALMRAPDSPEPADEAAPDFHALSCVTEVITTVVEPGKEADFRAWSERMQARQASFPGYMGTLVQAPLSGELPYWTTLVRFSTPAQLDAWLASAERKALLEGADPSVSTWKSRRMDNAFASWFVGPDDQRPPPAWKQTALVLLVLFPVVMLEIKFLSPYLAALPLAVATFIGNAISVALVSWPLMALAIAGLKWWLQPAPARRWRMEALGACTILGLYAVEIFTFTRLY